MRVTDKASGSHFCFPCRDWLEYSEVSDPEHPELLSTAVAASVQLNRQVEREVVPCKLRLSTGNYKDAAADGDAFVTLHGTLGSSDRIPLKLNLLRNETMRRGLEDEYQLQLPRLGAFQSLI